MPIIKYAVPIPNREVYYFIDKDGLPDQRVTASHPSIGMYIVRVSVLMYMKRNLADICCGWLNKMAYDREGASDRFKVINYKGSLKTFVVVRQLLVDDLVSAIDEFIEKKQR